MILKWSLIDRAMVLFQANRDDVSKVEEKLIASGDLSNMSEGASEGG